MTPAYFSNQDLGNVLFWREREGEKVWTFILLSELQLMISKQRKIQSKWSPGEIVSGQIYRKHLEQHLSQKDFRRNNNDNDDF